MTRGVYFSGVETARDPASTHEMAKPRSILFALVVSTAWSVVGASSPAQDASPARKWVDLCLESIRRDFGRPTVHARNLFHLSVAMWDAWAAFDPMARGFVLDERATSEDRESARRIAVSHAAYRVLLNRFGASPGYAVMAPRYVALMAEMGADPADVGTSGDAPSAIGNRVGLAVVQFGLQDGSNQANGYANLHYQPVNPALVMAAPGNPTMIDVARYQPLALESFVDQNGQVIPGGFPEFLSAEWGRVTPFALRPEDRDQRMRGGVSWNVYHDPGAPPVPGAPDGLWRRGHEMVVLWSSHLDPADGVTWDASPASMGNVTAPAAWDAQSYYRQLEGGDVGRGHSVNPFTGQPYAPNPMPRGDYARVLAEFWADGPSSETPPGHWFSILNYAMDHPSFVRRIGGVGAELGAFEYDVKAYLALGGAMHDVAVTSWSIKGWHDTSRPVSAIRWMCERGQSSDPSQPAYHPDGIALVPGHVEVVTGATTAPGGRHQDLKGYEGLIAVRAWRGPDYIGSPATDVAGVGWILGVQWWPYQRPTFVSPPFGGYVSGHSSFSRAAAHVLTGLTGSPWFPGGIGRFRAARNQYLVFEDGPSVDAEIQFATYFDAADQSAMSRIWGGIHPPFDDLPARGVGDRCGPAAVAFARVLWGPSACMADLDGNGVVDGADVGVLLAGWGGAGSADLDGSGAVDGADLGVLISSWGPCPGGAG